VRGGKLTNNSLLFEKYVAAAIAHSEASNVGNFKIANREYAKLTRIYRKFEKDHALAESMINELLKNPNRHVLGWASAHALGLNINVEKAEKILEDLSIMTDLGINRLGSEMTLKEWRKKGKLTF